VNDSTYTFAEPLKFVGHWKIGGPIGLRVSLMVRPRWLTRVMCKWLLEWEWEDT
jgi:hypothetical protein